MKTDTYTKIVLTVIAIMLAAIAFKPLISPEMISAQGSFAGVQFTMSGRGFYFFDTRTGEIWGYGSQDGTLGAQQWRLTKLGAPLSVK
jgi:hypothetical protein